MDGLAYAVVHNLLRKGNVVKRERGTANGRDSGFGIRQHEVGRGAPRLSRAARPMANPLPRRRLGTMPFTAETAEHAESAWLKAKTAGLPLAAAPSV